MKLKEITKQAYNSMLIEKSKDNIDKKTLEIIEKCIDNNIKFDINERELVEIEELYFKINKKIDFAFIKRVADNSVNKLDYEKFFKDVDESEK